MVQRLFRFGLVPFFLPVLNEFLKQDSQVVQKNPKTSKKSAPRKTSNKLLLFPTSSVKDVQKLAAYMAKYILSNDFVRKKQSFAKSDMERVLKLYLSNSKNKKIEGSLTIGKQDRKQPIIILTENLASS